MTLPMNSLSLTRSSSVSDSPKSPFTIKEIEIVPEVGRDVLRLLVIAVHIGDVNAVYAACLFIGRNAKPLARISPVREQ